MYKVLCIYYSHSRVHKIITTINFEEPTNPPPPPPHPHPHVPKGIILHLPLFLFTDRHMKPFTNNNGNPGTGMRNAVCSCDLIKSIIYYGQDCRLTTDIDIAEVVHRLKVIATIIDIPFHDGNLIFARGDVHQKRVAFNLHKTIIIINNNYKAGHQGHNLSLHLSCSSIVHS